MIETTILRDLIKYRTINNPHEGIYPDSKILSYVQNLVKRWNPDIQIEKFHEKGYSSIYIVNDLDNRPDVIFIGHFDVVPVSDGWRSDPFELYVDSNLGFGRGAKDCKGSILSALLMLKRVCEEKNPILNHIGFYFSLDEETGGKFGANLFFKHLKRKNILPKYVINVDGGPRVVHKRRGAFGVEIKVPSKIVEVFGKIEIRDFKVRIIGNNSRHSAYFVKGCDTHPMISLSKYLHLNRELSLSNLKGSWIKGNVIPENVKATISYADKESNLIISYDDNLTKLIRQLRSLILINTHLDEISEFGISVNPNRVIYSPIQGTEIYFDVRAFLKPNKKNLLIQSFEAMLGNLKNIAKITCTDSTGYFCTPRENILVEIASNILEKHNMISEPCEQEGASDARYVSKYGTPVIDLGPLGGEIHGSNEYVDLRSMRKFSYIYQEIIDKLIYGSTD